MIHDPDPPDLLKDPIKLQTRLKQKPEAFWVERGEEMALRLFHEMAAGVPAYKDFLSKNLLNPKKIQTIADFKQVPTINKDNYLRFYPREMMCWDGKLNNQNWVFSTTSGSTGEPYYFPRTSVQDDHYAVAAELYLRENFNIQDKSTLYVDAFAMGAWIGGLFTYQAIKQVADRGYRISIITPGTNKIETINAIKNLAADFDQVIIGCYPPLLKDIVDLGKEHGVDWTKINLGIVFSAEGFSEAFRDYIVSNASLDNVYTSTLNHYGTVDMGTMAHETPLSIFLRRQALDDLALFSALFKGISKQPTFAQYLPEMFYFEAVENNLLCSGYSGLPLVRYDLKDYGGIIKLDQVEKIYKEQGKGLDKELASAGIRETKWNLPFVYLYERSDFSVTFMGATIFPEEIRRALLTKSVTEYVTGKFTLEVVQDKHLDNKLMINVELKRGVEKSPAIAGLIQKIIKSVLLLENSEYANNYASYGRKLLPRIKLWPNEHNAYFDSRGKHRWIK